jgi:hypothetical protein
MMLAIGLSHVAFIILRYVPSIHSFFRTFIMKGCWILSRAHICFYWDIHVVFVLVWRMKPLLICIGWTILASLEWDLLIMVYDLFNVLLDLACSYFIEDFYIYVIRKIGP